LPNFFVIFSVWITLSDSKPTLHDFANDSLIIQVIIFTSVAMMLGMWTAKPKPVQTSTQAG